MIVINVELPLEKWRQLYFSCPKIVPMYVLQFIEIFCNQLTILNTPCARHLESSHVSFSFHGRQ